MKGLELFVSTEGEPRGEPSMVFGLCGAAAAALGSLALLSNLVCCCTRSNTRAGGPAG